MLTATLRLESGDEEASGPKTILLSRQQDQDRWRVHEPRSNENH
jgi:hypothetical protein